MPFTVSEVAVELHTESDCTDTLLDLLCYEVLRHKLSPDMEDVLNRHLRGCPSCRRKVLAFRQILRAEAACVNFG